MLHHYLSYVSLFFSLFLLTTCDWIEDKLKELEDGCMELSYEALTHRYISILHVYKYSDNPDGYRYNKCYLRFQELSEERLAKVRNMQERIEKSQHQSNQRQTNYNQERQNLDRKRQEAENIELKEKKARSKMIWTIVGLLLFGGVFIGGICFALSRRAYSQPSACTTNPAGQSLLSSNVTHSVPALIISRPQTPATVRLGFQPLTPAIENLNTSRDIDQPPSYNDAVRYAPPAPPP